MADSNLVARLRENVKWNGDVFPIFREAADEIERLRAREAEQAETIERLRGHVNAMCGWAEILAEERDWTRGNAAAYWASYDAARAAVLRPANDPASPVSR